MFPTTGLPDRVFCLMVGSRYYTDPDFPALSLRVFVDAEGASNYRAVVEPFADSSLEVREVSLADAYFETKRESYGEIALVLSHCEVFDEVEDVEVLFDPSAAIH